MSEEMTDEKKRETEGELPAEETNGSGNDAETVRCEKNDGEKTDGEKAEGKKCAGPDGEKGEKCEKKKKLFAELEAAKKEAEENKRKWYAVTAEYENYRRRTEKQSAQRYADGRNDVIAALFPVGDNLERALSSCADEQTKKGLEMVLKSFEKLLADEGIETISPVGQPFSADEAEAIMAVPAEEGEVSGTVPPASLNGSRKSGKVLRYAQVVVIS